MKDDDQLGNHDGDPAGGLDDDELRALFGADIRGDQQDEDITENDQRFLRGLFAADVATPPPSRMTVASILAAARNGDQPAVEHDPDTDRRRPVVGLPTPADSAGPSGASGQSGPPGFVDRTRRRSAPAGASPVWSGDEVGARRRRRNIRTGLLTAAAVAAVVAIGVPIALNSGNTSQTGADSPAGAAGQSTAAASAQDAPESGPAPEAPGDSARAASGSGSDSGGNSSGSAAAAPPGSRASAGSSGSPTRAKTPPEAASPNSRTQSQEEASATSSSGGSAAASATDGNRSATGCRWPELPASVDRAATTVFGAGVVGRHRVLSSSCLPSRVAGGVFPAANGIRGSVTVEVVAAATAGDCAAEHCRRIGAGSYVGQSGELTFVWLYQGGRQIKVGASTGLKLGQASLISFAKVVGSIIR
jgi:hypothetical protein